MSAQPIEPIAGVYDMDEAAYFAHPALSCSGAKKLLPPSCPALFKHDRDNGQAPRAVFDFGHAAHKLVLGTGAPIAVIHADDWRGRAARENRDEAYAAGAIPLLVSEHERVQAMADRLREHPTAAALLNPEHGTPEQSLFSIDPVTGVELRGRLDWLPNASSNGVMVVADYKTARSAEPGTFARAAASFGYHMQAAWYSDLVTANGLAEQVIFRFVVQEKTAPYLLSVVELDDEALAAGRLKNREAIDIYADCVKHDRWPGYSADVELISLPMWATSDLDLDVI